MTARLLVLAALIAAVLLLLRRRAPEPDRDEYGRLPWTDPQLERLLAAIRAEP